MDKNEKLKRKKDYSKERMALYDKFVEVFN